MSSKCLGDACKPNTTAQYQSVYAGVIVVNNNDTSIQLFTLTHSFDSIITNYISPDTQK